MGVALAQVSQDDKSQVSQDDKSPIAIPDSKREPQSFTVGLSESVGVGDNP
ncbi:hypothetical protein BG20_I1996 [Candidatus Nitrosarchaeum limnium BG20]|uniref:Uncharacterized protein n=2 Tax=Nitrosarchaeum TaxID=1007082 RepID=S2END2_9ARCH|nr:hypothetical protein BG20_I1996 [Candidatus Nitrosarchaeum limnium BG20]